MKRKSHPQVISARLLHTAFTLVAYIHAIAAEKITKTEIRSKSLAIDYILSQLKKKFKYAVWKKTKKLMRQPKKICKKCGRKMAAKTGNTSNKFVLILIFTDTIPPCRQKCVAFITSCMLRPYDFRDAEGIGAFMNMEFTVAYNEDVM